VKESTMFEYFENNYPWNLAVVTALGMGAVASDVDTACRPLRAVADGDVGRSSAAWADAWSSLAERLRRQARRDESEHHRRSAGEKYLRGALYLLMAERALRCVAIGRKNYLFAGSDAGGRRAAAMYSLIESAKLNGLNPQHYLTDLLARIADHPARRIAELLPWNWQPADTARAAA